MSERWLPIAGYEGTYDISDHGRVRSRGRYVQAKLGSQRWQSARILSPGRQQSGHLSVRLTRDAKGRSIGVHRLVLLTFVGPCPTGMECCHNNGVHDDNRLVNLRWDTRSANQRDSVRHGTQWNTRKTECKYGHEFTPENTYYYTYSYGSKRKCKTCTLTTPWKELSA